MRHADGADGLAGVGRTIETGVENVDRVLDLGIGVYARVVERTLAQPPVFVDLFQLCPASSDRNTPPSAASMIA